MTLENYITFDKDIVKTEKLTKNSRLNWNVVSPQVRQDQTYFVQVTELILNDEIMSVSPPKDKLMMFSVEPGPLRMYDYEDGV